MSFDVPSWKRLEDAFFAEQDQKLMDRLRSEEKSQQKREALKTVSGIDNQQVLDKLVELQIRPETVASLALVPLVEVAWADGFCHEKEKMAILEAVHKIGMIKGSIDYDLLANWLDHQPEPELMEAWKHFVKGLCSVLTKGERELFKQAILSEARTVAAAAGGFLGIGKTSRAEKEMIASLQLTFDELGKCEGGPTPEE